MRCPGPQRASNSNIVAGKVGVRPLLISGSNRIHHPVRSRIWNYFLDPSCGGGLEPGMLEYAFPAWAGTHKYQEPHGGE